MEHAIVLLLVACCAAYSLRRLLPAGAKRLLGHALQRSGLLPARMRQSWVERPEAESGCGTACGGCGGAAAKPATAHTVHWLAPAKRPVDSDRRQRGR